MKYINHEEKTVNSPKSATHYSKHPKGSINQFYRYYNDMLQYYSIFNEWKKSNSKDLELFKI